MVAHIDDINYKELYESLLKEFNIIKEERDYWKEQYINADNLNKLLGDVPQISKGPTPTENRQSQGKMTGKWTSYDKMENFDIFN